MLFRRFAREKRFQTAVFFLRGLTDAAEMGKKLAEIADCVIKILFSAVAKDFERRFGKFDAARAAFVLTGKGGSREMSFQSDLDILFVYDADENAQSDGQTPLYPPVYYARLTQRLVSALTANTREGVLWPADMRLRPSGSAGPVATSFKSFKRYYADSAWTWELQALTKARVVCATDGFKEELEKTIAGILCTRRDKNALANDVNTMRANGLRRLKTFFQRFPHSDNRILRRFFPVRFFRPGIKTPSCACPAIKRIGSSAVPSFVRSLYPLAWRTPVHSRYSFAKSTDCRRPSTVADIAPKIRYPSCLAAVL